MVNNKLICLFVIFLLIGMVSASDVAYIYKMKGKIDKNIVNFFLSVNLTTDFVSEKNLSKANLSKYKLIYVGDEQFTKEIPIYKFRTVVSNYYLGYVFGLTDNDGVSRLVSTSPLIGIVNGSNLKIYSAAKDSHGISIPCYFIDQDNKVSSLQTFLGTSSSSGNNFGDIISFVDKGASLGNNKTAQNNICFFGIVKSNYWTNQSKKLFVDCVKHVYDYTLKVESTNQSDIGFDDIENPVNESEINNSAENNTVLNETKQNQTEINNKTNNSTIINNITAENNTYGNNSIQNNTNNFDDNLSENNTDSGLNNTIQNNTIENNTNPIINNSFGNNSSDSLNNNSGIENISNDIIENSTSENNTDLVICYNDSDCGNTIDLGNSCSENKIIENLFLFKCNNPGTNSSFCSNESFVKIINNCSDYCENSSCMKFKCKDNNECDDLNNETVDFCVNSDLIYSKCVFIGKNFTTRSSLDNVIFNFSFENVSGYKISQDNINWFSVNESLGSYIFENLTSDSDYNFFIEIIYPNASVPVINVSARTLKQESENSVSDSRGSDDVYRGGGGDICVTKWSCTYWSSCKDGRQYRNCYYPPNFCEPTEDKPEEVMNCVEEIIPNVSYTQETPENDSINQSFSITGGVIGALGNYPLFLIILFLIIIVIVYFYVRNRKTKFFKKLSKR